MERTSIYTEMECVIIVKRSFFFADSATKEIGSLFQQISTMNSMYFKSFLGLSFSHFKQSFDIFLNVSLYVNIPGVGTFQLFHVQYLVYF